MDFLLILRIPLFLIAWTVMPGLLGWLEFSPKGQTLGPLRLFSTIVIQRMNEYMHE